MPLVRSSSSLGTHIHSTHHDIMMSITAHRIFENQVFSTPGHFFFNDAEQQQQTAG
jgi:hypothetical protein